MPMPEEKIDIFKSGLVPMHELLNGDEKADLLERLNVAQKQLPKIREADPAVKAIGAKKGDIIRITRKSASGETYYYRTVV